MDKVKFDPDWMKDPEMMKEIIREQMIEYGQVIARQAEEIEALQNKLNHFMNDAETKQEIIYKLQRKLEIRQLGEKACDRNDEALKKLLDNPPPPNDLVKEIVKNYTEKKER